MRGASDAPRAKLDAREALVQQEHVIPVRALHDGALIARLLERDGGGREVFVERGALLALRSAPGK